MSTPKRKSSRGTSLPLGGYVGPALMWIPILSMMAYTRVDEWAAMGLWFLCALFAGPYCLVYLFCAVWRSWDWPGPPQVTEEKHVWRRRLRECIAVGGVILSLITLGVAFWVLNV